MCAVELAAGGWRTARRAGCWAVVGLGFRVWRADWRVGGHAAGQKVGRECGPVPGRQALGRTKRRVNGRAQRRTTPTEAHKVQMLKRMHAGRTMEPTPCAYLYFVRRSVAMKYADCVRICPASSNA